MIRAERIPSYDDRAEIEGRSGVARDAHDDAPPPRRWGRFLFLFVLAVVLVGGGAWAWLVHGKRMTALFAGGGGEGVPVVRADSAPFKIRPRDPGGMEVPDRDKLVYGRLQGEAAELRVERLLPPVEAPMRPPRAASDPAPPVKESLPRTPTEAQVRAAVKPPPPPAIDLSKAVSNREPAPEDSPPTDPETAPLSPLAAPLASAGEPPLADSQFRPPTGGTSRPPTGGTARAPAPQIAAAPAEPASGYLIQIAAVREPERAEVEWERLLRQHPETLRGLKLFVARADLGDKGVFWRLRAGPFADETAAKNRCAELASRKVGCLVVKAQG